MLSNFDAILYEKCKISVDDRLLLGFSGGPDSLCLLHALHSLGYVVTAAHLDHQLRRESAEEARRAGVFAASLGVEFTSGSVDVASFCREHGFSLEEGARQARYRFLFEEARNSGAQAVLVGHTADDQVETVLMHLLRGAGLSGLAGMAYRSLPNAWSQTIPLARPLLGVWREQVWQYVEENGLSPNLDPTNLDVRFHRNKLRHEIIPYLETVNPHIRLRIWQTAEILRAEDEVLQERLSADWEAVVLEEHPSEILIDAGAFKQLALGRQRRIFKKAIQHLRPDARDVDFQVIERAIELANSRESNARTDLVAGLVLKRLSGKMWLSDLRSRPNEPGWPEIPGGTSQELPVPGELRISGGWFFRSAVQKNRKELLPEILGCNDPFQTWLDLDNLHIPLRVRGRQAGDRFQPLGMPAGSTKVSDFMINVRLPEPARRNWPLVLSGESIAWIPGYRPAHPFRITRGSSNVAHIQLLRIENP